MKKNEIESRWMEEFAALMIEKVEKIDRDWTKPWLTTLAAPRNLQGRLYSGTNSLMLMLQQEKKGYRFPIYGTFEAFQKLNYEKNALGKEPIKIKKGEKSFPVIYTSYTCVKSETKERISYEEYKQMSLEEKATYDVYPKTNVYSVFNVDQTTMEEVRPEIYEVYAKEYEKKAHEDNYTFEPLDEMIEKDSWLCKIEPEHQDMAYYDIRLDKITVPEKKQFRDGESFYGTLFHEMAHSTGAEGRLNRFTEECGWGLSNNFYAKEELVAELTAALVASRYGISKHLKDDSASYLKSWLNELKERPEFMKTLLRDVRKASSMITEQIEAKIEKEKAA